jgi:ADP-ribose pyrophosphatase YjhB (NUDIX family)
MKVGHGLICVKAAPNAQTGAPRREAAPNDDATQGHSCRLSAGRMTLSDRYTDLMLSPRSIRHCKSCGAATDYLVPPDDNRHRAVCSACKVVHYENPLNVVGTVPIWGEQVLLCRRNIEPRHGFWTLPAGFMELGETLAQGAIRETVEEAGANFELKSLFSLLNVVRAGQVHVFYLAELSNTTFAPGPETIEARLFHEHEVPWDELAFLTVRETLKRYFADRRQGQFGFHCADIE